MATIGAAIITVVAVDVALGLGNLIGSLFLKPGASSARRTHAHTIIVGI